MEMQASYYNFKRANSDLSGLLNNCESLSNNFNVYKFSQCQEIFLEHNKFNTPIKDRCAILVSGSIASGKSLTIANLIKIYGLHGREYINSEYFYFNYFNSESFSKGYKKGKLKGIERINYNLDHGNSFIFEFVLAKQDKFELIEKLKKYNYKIISIFIGSDESIIYKRASKREKEGYYYVDRCKIKERYIQVNENQKYLEKVSDCFYYIPNYVDQKNYKLKSSI